MFNSYRQVTEGGVESQSHLSRYNWTDHARQWLKGGAVVFGTVALGGLTYFVGSGLLGTKREVSESGNGQGVEWSDTNCVIEPIVQTWTRYKKRVTPLWRD